ncbi:GIY-YIG nuclease family protein [Paenibacillus sp. sgz500958]|uniref:GIY-YIG nuclease family protein n=1 Tax=Paenibacillus sp. sgz500958 TaxID=3242475 RepID=UPI0036D3473B
MDKARRKEISYNYAHSHRQMGAYRLLNTVNGKSFVGTALNLEGVWNKHKFMLDINNHNNKELQEDWKKYGEASFQFEILEEIKPEEEFIQNPSEQGKYRKMMPDLESKWMEQLSPYGERGYHKQPQIKD